MSISLAYFCFLTCRQDCCIYSGTIYINFPVFPITAPNVLGLFISDKTTFTTLTPISARKLQKRQDISSLRKLLYVFMLMMPPCLPLSGKWLVVPDHSVTGNMLLATCTVSPGSFGNGLSRDWVWTPGHPPLHPPHPPELRSYTLPKADFHRGLLWVFYRVHVYCVLIYVTWGYNPPKSSNGGLTETAHYMH